MKQKKLESSEKGTEIKSKTCLEATVPLWSMTYDQQLMQKENELLDILKSYATEVQKTNPNVNEMISNRKKDNNGLPCVWLGYKASPQILGYRNKSEFTVGNKLRYNLKFDKIRIIAYTNWNFQEKIHQELKPLDLELEVILKVQ